MTKLKRFGTIEKSGAMRDLLRFGVDKRKARRLLRGIRADAVWHRDACLGGAFIWKNTKQGLTFWVDIIEASH